MERLRITGGERLQGTVAIAGAKNASLPIIAASLLSPETLTITNLPALTDVATMLDVIAEHGAHVDRNGPHQVAIDGGRVDHVEASYGAIRRMRATVLVLGPLVARFGKARVSLPGGCAIGTRPVDLHLKALQTLGTTVDTDGGTIVANAPNGLTGARIVLASPSVGATETAMMAATAAKGETEIINAAQEPEVVDLATCLVAMGAEIEGAGTHRILIRGETIWRTAKHAVIPDRVETGTYAVAAAITGGQLELAGARLEHLAAPEQVLESCGVAFWPSDRGLIVSAPDPLQAMDITTEPFPGFPTDLQAQFMALMSVAEGTSTIRETVFENRFMHVPELNRLGADIKLQGTVATVKGSRELKGAPVAATDLRASVSLVLAGLAATGETVIENIFHLDRGYEALDVKLTRCGARIERLSG